MGLRCLIAIFFLIILLSCPIFLNETKAGTISLAPVAQGTEYRYLRHYYYSIYIPKDVIVTYHIKARYNNLKGFRRYNEFSTGLIEFDISSLSSLTPGTFSSELILYSYVSPSHT